jgi:hypothetical protein
MAGPVLEEPHMNIPTMQDVLGERLVDAREAAHCLNIPTYLLTHPKERERLLVPHYRVGKLVRFKLQELIDWLEQQGGKSHA